MAAISLGACATTVHAGVPEPEAGGIPCSPLDRSVWLLEPGGVGCQYRFTATGSLDELVVLVTLRDCFDTPVPDCGVQATIKENAGTLALCTCEDPVQLNTSDADGAVEFRYSRIGGRGSLSVGLTLVCAGWIGLPDLIADFTSPDMNGSCEPDQSLTIQDIGLMSLGLYGPYLQTSDFTCDGVTDILDIGLFSRGIGNGCSSP